MFASHFLAPVVDGPDQPQPVYDEERSLNLDSDGRPLVESVPTAQTRTVTEVRAESDDLHREDGAMAGALGTVTKVASEPPDSFAAFGTNTRVRGERTDYADPDEGGSRFGGAASLLGTQTNNIKSENGNLEESFDSTFSETVRESVEDKSNSEVPTSMTLGTLLRG